MDIDSLKLSDHIKIHCEDFILYPGLWKEFDHSLIDLSVIQWKEIKFLNEDGDDLNPLVKSITEEKGGIYLFMIKSNVLVGISEYLVYIGRAQKTDTHNLRVRLRKYYYEYFGKYGRPKVTRMINKWGPYLYLKYFELEDNDLVVMLEAELINSVLPPFNDEIPKKRIRDAVNAF